MAESLPGPSVEKKRKTSGARFKFSWTFPENSTSSAKSYKLPIASSASAILKSQQSSMTKLLDTASSSQTNKR